jgi:hypothetical protein
MHRRTPVVIFLSDGEDDVGDDTIVDICRSAVRQGFVDFRPVFRTKTDNANARRPLSLHAVSFGQDSTSSSLRRMAQIASDVQNSAPQDPLLPATANVPSSYTEALDTVRSNITFSASPSVTHNSLGEAGRDVPRDRRIVEKAAWFLVFIFLSRTKATFL